MTEAQVKAILRIHQYMKEWHLREGYEYKRFDLMPLIFGIVEVRIEIGRKNDEGTLAEVFCRDRWQIFVGVRGGLSASVKSKKEKHGSARVTGRACLYRRHS